MRKKTINITEAEWEVMKVAWGHSPRAAQEIIDALAVPMKWTPATIKTLINRLLKKGALGFEKNGREYSYFPTISHEECARAEGRSFLKRVHDGAVVPMIVNLVGDQKLTKKEIEQLREFFERKAKS
jgi:BlaI family transcriptional regulator, penicillinase repressor